MQTLLIRTERFDDFKAFCKNSNIEFKHEKTFKGFEFLEFSDNSDLFEIGFFFAQNVRTIQLPEGEIKQFAMFVGSLPSFQFDFIFSETEVKIFGKYMTDTEFYHLIKSFLKWRI